jgi:hypothetical protein
MNQRLNTKDLMMHKHFYVEFKDCVLCDNCPQETLMHLFFECNYSQAFWWALNIEWDTDRDLHDMISVGQEKILNGVHHGNYHHWLLGNLGLEE